MKVLIVGVGRSGTSSLSNGFKEQGYLKIGEPYNYGLWVNKQWKYPLDELNSTSNIIVKTLVPQIPKTWDKNWYEFIHDFKSNFDKIIFLDRMDTDEHLLSFMNLYYKTYVKKLSDAHTNWKEEDISTDFKSGYLTGGGKTRLIEEKRQLHNLIEMLSESIVWYEDLYGRDRNKSLEIIQSWKIQGLDCKKLNEFLHPRYKQKQISKKVLI